VLFKVAVSSPNGMFINTHFKLTRSSYSGFWAWLSAFFKSNKNRQRYRERLRKKNKIPGRQLSWFLAENNGYLFFETAS